MLTTQPCDQTKTFANLPTTASSTVERKSLQFSSANNAPQRVHGLTYGSETIGRESFNRDFGKVWEKRTRQTGRSSGENHEDVARAMRQNANTWLDVRERHAEAQLDLGILETDLTPYSSWGSHGGSHRS